MNTDTILLVLMSFGLGYVIGSLDYIRRILSSSSSTSFVSEVSREQKQNARKKVSIDETKYVTNISTDDLEVKGTSLGIVSQTNDDISSASSKLAQFKKMKG